MLPGEDRFHCLFAALFILYRYDSSTGTFTVPSGGDGFYYFSACMRVYGAEMAEFFLEINGELICTVSAELRESSSTDREITSCSGATYATEGIRRYLFNFLVPHSS